MAPTAHNTAGRRAVLRPARPNTRTPVRARRDPRQLHHAALAAGVRRRFAPHQMRHAHAVEMSREGISLIVIQRQLGHADLAITSRYLRGIDNAEIVQAVHERPEPMIPASRRLAPLRSTADPFLGQAREVAIRRGLTAHRPEPIKSLYGAPLARRRTAGASVIHWCRADDRSQLRPAVRALVRRISLALAQRAGPAQARPRRRGPITRVRRPVWATPRRARRRL